MELTNDEMMMAKGIVNSIIRDGAGDAFLKGTDDQRKDLMFAYLDAEIKKYEKFQTKLMTNSGAMEAFVKSVFSII
jgi:hypothetical protein